ncbi:MAG: ribosome recycling factor [Ardenticatenales bacterium]|nr:ribosome recycling factor [Ardenticatenales bacterium]
MVKETLKDAEDRMSKAIDSLETDLRAIRTGRANPALLDRLTIDYYGVQTPINQVASVTAPEGRLLTIKPWDKSSLKAIEKAIRESDLGLTPGNDGTIIRLVLPQLTKERRHDLVKQVGKRGEESRVAIRNIRRDVLKDLEEGQKEGLVTEDELYRSKEQVQHLTDEYIKHVEELAKIKEEEIMEF